MQFASCLTSLLSTLKGFTILVCCYLILQFRLIFPYTIFWSFGRIFACSFTISICIHITRFSLCSIFSFTKPLFEIRQNSSTLLARLLEFIQDFDSLFALKSFLFAGFPFVFENKYYWQLANNSFSWDKEKLREYCFLSLNYSNIFGKHRCLGTIILPMRLIPVI